MRIDFEKAAMLGVACLGITFASTARADEWDKRTIITVSEAVQIQGNVLEPGEHVIKLLNYESDRRILQIYNGDETKLQATVLALPAYRLEPTGDTRFSFYEMSTGQPPALRTWFYPGDNSGLEFTVRR